jgi:TolA-binding protein
LAEVGLKEFTAAVATFNALLTGDEKYPNRDKALYELAWAYRSVDQNDKSNETFTALTEKHPDSPFAAESFFHVGESKYQADEFATAVTAYAAAKTKSTRDELTEKSTYKLGWANFRLEKYEDALQEFSAQAESFPQGELNSDALFMKAESLFKLDKYPEALAAFDGVSGKKLRSPKMDVLVLLHGGQSAARAKKWDDSLKYLEQIPAKFPDSTFLAEAHYELGWVKQNSDKATEAMTDYELAATKSRGETGARARFMMGELLFAEKKHDEAIIQFKRCMYGFGGATATDAVKNWQAKSGLEAGRCAETQVESAQGADRTKRIDEAKAYFQFVLQNHSKHELAAQAKTRLTNLSKL